jgi:hypothetical protein
MDPNTPQIAQVPAQPSSDLAGAGDGKSKFEQFKELAALYISYEKLLIVDAVLAAIHLLAIFIVAMQYLMLFTLFGIRAPRMALNFIAKRK